MKIEFLRLDLHLKRKQKKNHKDSTNVFIREERKKKKKNPETIARRPGSRCDLGSPRDLDLSRAACVAGLDLARPRSA